MTVFCDQHTKRPCGLMDKALVLGTKDCRFESCQGHSHGPEGWCSVVALSAHYSQILSCFFDSQLPSRSESGWCSDVTSTHGAWRHAGVRFLLSGAFHFGPRGSYMALSVRPAPKMRAHSNKRICGAPKAWAQLSKTGGGAGKDT